VTVSRDSLFLWLWIPDLHSASLRLSGTTLESVGRKNHKKKKQQGH
jgi:hypothetical protein